MFKKSLTALTVALAIAVPTTALASTPTRSHVRTYNHLRHEVIAKDGIRAPGRNIVKYGLTPTKLASDADIVASIGVMERMLDPYVAPVETQATTTTIEPAANINLSTSASLEECIIQHESGGNPEATNGIYSGLGQWSPAAWAEDGGTQYASTPLEASAAEQEQVLSNEGAIGQEQQQAQFDGC